MNKTIEEAIREIIEKIPEVKIFDSHFVIEQLIKNQKDVYLNFASTNNVAPNSGAANGLIALIIKKQDDLVQRAPNTNPGDFFSKNSREKNSSCTGWEKSPKQEINNTK